MREALLEIKADIAVVDWLSSVTCELADELGIPCILNFPLPLEAASNFIGNLTLTKNMSSCCGVICLQQPALICVVNCVLRIARGEHLRVHRQKMLHRVILINSYFGWDEPSAIPPNIVMTGPLQSSIANI